MAEQHSQTADYDNRWKFTGHELDRETGLYYAGARYYDPKISIWLSVDPLAEKFSSWNPYNYVMQNPINLIDPTGMEPEGDLDTGPPKGTYLIVYAAGWDNPEAKSHNQGSNFQKNAEAQKQNLIKSGVPESDIVITKAQTKDEFITAVNTKYTSGEIVQMDVYSHSAANLLNLGGYEGMEPAPDVSTPADKDYRYVHLHDMSKIDVSNFSKDSKVTLWGCNAGKVVKGADPIAQIFANRLNLGGNNTVMALDGFSEHKQSSTGKLIFDGTMIRSKDRATQKVNLTTFKPKP